jgi:hypothetical protein
MNQTHESGLQFMLSNQDKTNSLFNLIIKCTAIFFLFSISILIVSCGSNGTGQLNPGTPVVTVTIKLGQDIGSPTPTLSPYNCGGWATDTSPSFSSTSTVSIFGKFTQIVDGNPVGIGGATATATIQWPDGTSDTMATTTTSDGLAVFPVAIKPTAINKLVTISIVFTKTGIQQCTIPSPAFFTAILVSPTPPKTVVPSSSTTPTPLGTAAPTFTPPPIPTKGH